MIDLTQIHSVSDFIRNAKAHIERLKKTGRPEVLTVNGTAEVVVQDAASYQELLDRLELAESNAAIRESVEQATKGETRDALAAIEELRAKIQAQSKNNPSEGS